MSESFEELADCPQCGKEQNVTLWQSIDVDVNPELKEKFFEGEINLHKCDSCGFQAPVEMDLFYHDGSKELLVYYFPFEYFTDNDDEAADALDHFKPNGELDLDHKTDEEETPPDYLMKPHVVFSLEEMLRYIAFRDALYEWNQAQEG